MKPEGTGKTKPVGQSTCQLSHPANRMAQYQNHLHGDMGVEKALFATN